MIFVAQLVGMAYIWLDVALINSIEIYDSVIVMF
jgi:hypothetical protein